MRSLHQMRKMKQLWRSVVYLFSHLPLPDISVTCGGVIYSEIWHKNSVLVHYEAQRNFLQLL